MAQTTNGRAAQAAPAKFTITKGRQKKARRIGIYGPPGVGKSTLVAHSPSTALIDVENGSNELDAVRMTPRDANGVEVPWTFPQILAAVSAFETSPEFRDFSALAIDTLTKVEGLIWADVCRLSGVDYLEDVGGGWGKGVSQALDEWRRLLAALDRVVATGRHVILTMHATVKTVANPMGDNFDRYLPQLHQGASGNQGAAGLITGWLEILMFGYYEVTGDKKTRKGSYTGSRILHTQWHAAWEAKSRVALPPEIPMDAGAFWSALEEGEVATPGHLLRLIENTQAQLHNQKVVTGSRAAVDQCVAERAEDGTVLKADTGRLWQILDRLNGYLRIQRQEEEQAKPEEEAPAGGAAQ